MFRKIIAWIVLAGLVWLIAWRWTEYYFWTHTHDIYVKSIDAPEICYERGTGRWDKTPRRSSAPELLFYSYCGGIRTDRGAYEIPDSHKWPGIPEDRQEILSQLREGCRYTVRIVGSGDPFPVGGPNIIPIRQRISNIIEAHPCDAGEAE